MAHMQKRLANYRLFLTEFRRTFRTTGAVLPSGRALSQALANPVSEAGRPARVLEVGPGTGEITARIAAAMGPEDTLDLVELNDRFVSRLRHRLKDDPRFHSVAPRTTLHHANIEEIEFAQPFDVVVSGLPLNNFSVEEVERILSRLLGLLRPGGTLSFFEYIAVRRAKAMLSGSADRTRLRGIGRVLARIRSDHPCGRKAIWLNMPPAWAHHVNQIP